MDLDEDAAASLVDGCGLGAAEFLVTHGGRLRRRRDAAGALRHPGRAGLRRGDEAPHRQPGEEGAQAALADASALSRAARCA
jgi:hypothetical protein